MLRQHRHRTAARKGLDPTRLMLLIMAMCTIAAAQSKGGRWQFEQDGADSAPWDGAANTGQLINQAAYATVPPLVEGQAYLFLDSTVTYSYFRVPDDPDLDFSGENVGISAWVHPLVIDDVQYLVIKGVQNTVPKTTNYALRLSRNAELEFLIRDANDRAQRVTSSFTVPTGTWTFVAAWYDIAAGLVYLWNDPAGAAVDTLAFQQALLPNDGPLSIGAWYRDTPAQPSVMEVKGRMDDVRISGRQSDLFPGVTAVDAGPVLSLPSQPVLEPNFPNPFNPTTRIRFAIPNAATVRLTVFNVAGEMVAELVDGFLPPGRYERQFDGAGLTSGVYLVRLTAGSYHHVGKMILTR